MNKRRFTLVEVMTAVAVFSIFMVLIIQFFVAAQKLWHATETETRLSNKAALVFNTIERCIRGAKLGQSPFYMSNATEDAFDIIISSPNGKRWEQDPNAYTAANSTKLVFVCRSEAKLHSGSLGKLYIIGFVQAQDRIQLRAICDRESNFWTLCSANRNDLLDEFDDAQGAWLGTSNDEFGSGQEGTSRVTHNLIDHVTSFEAIPYKLASGSSTDVLIPCDVTDFVSPGAPPYALMVKIVLLSDDDYAKWKTLCEMNAGSESDAAKEFRKKAERSFSRLIYVGKSREVPNP
ncbi:MAG: hypothetical protein VB042_02720 [Victivallaceae bacterium]|nr:hypothetical protein [Victivallaceae bacterium]